MAGWAIAAWIATCLLSGCIWDINRPATVYVHGLESEGLANHLSRAGYRVKPSSAGAIGSDVPVVVVGAGVDAGRLLRTLAALDIDARAYWMQYENHFYTYGRAGLYLPTVERSGVTYADSCGEEFVSLELLPSGTATIGVEAWIEDAYRPRFTGTGTVVVEDGVRYLSIEPYERTLMVERHDADLDETVLELVDADFLAGRDCALRPRETGLSGS
ncbi:MAG: hypothetical protein AAGE01_11700 [Pseudomonadota bacterium]